MRPEQDTITIPRFSEDILFPLIFLKHGRDRHAHAMRIAVLERALNSYFFGGRTFVFMNALPFRLPPDWVEKETGKQIVYLDAMPDVYGCASEDDAKAKVEALCHKWGFTDVALRYNGRPNSAKYYDDNEHEAGVHKAVWEAVREAYGEDCANRALRQRRSHSRESQYSFVTLADSHVFEKLVMADAPVWGKNRMRERVLPLALPDGSQTQFTLRVERAGILADLTRHYFGDRQFEKAKPFTMYERIDEVKQTRAMYLMVQVSPEVLGCRTVEEAHEAIVKQINAMGYGREAMTLQIAQTMQWNLAHIDAIEANPKIEGTIYFRPLKP